MYSSHVKSICTNCSIECVCKNSFLAFSFFGTVFVHVFVHIVHAHAYKSSLPSVTRLVQETNKLIFARSITAVHRVATHYKFF